MRDKLGPGTTLSYCTNVHPGSSLSETQQQLGRHAVAVKALLCPGEPLGVGLWIPFYPHSDEDLDRAVDQMERHAESGQIPPVATTARSLARFLLASGIEPVTCNAFPFSNFHDEVVKHRVYEPTWADLWREVQTVAAWSLMEDLSRGLDSLSISTLPIGWNSIRNQPDVVEIAGSQLRKMAEWLRSSRESGRVQTTIDLEPEPGCYLDTCDDVIAFFDEHLPDPMHRAHIGVCHDVCHAAVMFEDQREVLRRYAEAGIRVNKVQISSALDVDVGTLGVKNTIERLHAFAEPRYLHQTGFMTGDHFELIEDLPFAIQRLESGTHPGDHPDHARVHFHVPIYLDRIGDLGTTNGQIMDAVLAAREYHDTRHFEVETYAWGVLPQEHRRETLAEGIADELQWVLDTIAPAARAIVPAASSHA